MIVDTNGPETLKVIKDLQQEGIDSYVALMRHAERYIDTAENDELMGLTEEGKQAAREFGKGLSPEALIRFFSSPVGRCVETSSLIEQGYLINGGTAEGNLELDALYVSYVNDLPTLGQIAYGMYGDGEWRQFLRNWFDGKYSPELANNPDQSAQAMLDALISLLQEPGVGNICISHDWNLFLIKEYFLGLRHEENGYIQYLEGVIIYKKNGSYFISNHQTDAKRLPIP